MELLNVEKILGGNKTLHMKILTRMDLIELSKRGLTKRALLNLAKFLNISTNQMSKLLPVTERTIQRYKSSEHFSHFVSEQIIQIAEVAARGMEVFGDKEKFLKWLSIPHRTLGNKSPISLLDSRFGTEMVLDELWRIEYGVYS